MSFITSIHLKHFRCFTQARFELDAPFVIIEGNNGSGKTSLLEAVHYLCYARSFRTHIPSELIFFSKQAFFIEATLSGDVVSIGSSGARRQIKVNQKAITSYDELRTLCRIVTVTQEDLAIVQESPEKRRFFIDHALALYDKNFAPLMKRFRHTLEQRNAFLMRGGSSIQEGAFWTHQLWEHSRIIQTARIQYLDQLRTAIGTLAILMKEEREMQFSYQAKQGLLSLDYEAFCVQAGALFERERHIKRSLFGAHLDDIEILFNAKPARIYASRGQQKLLILLLKLGQVVTLSNTQTPLIVLLDDVLSDLDVTTLKKILSLCTASPIQTILTTPLSSGPELIALKQIDFPFLKISI